ncbi:fluoride efflux transporter FluC [Kitasatospora sp. NPDC004531]
MGAAIGAVTRYGVERLWPTEGTHFPWPILAINGAGCLAMGALMTVLTVRFPRQKKTAGALLGTGFLGGFSTFSHFTDNIRQLVDAGAWGTAVGYLALTVAAALAGVTVGVLVARAFVGIPTHQVASDAR